jgi:hypothetical protein
MKGLHEGAGPGGPKLKPFDATSGAFEVVDPVKAAAITKVRAMMRIACFMDNSPKNP